MHTNIIYMFGLASSVHLVTDYRLDGLGIESIRARFFAVQPGRGYHTTACAMGTVSFPEVKYSRGVLLTTHLLLVPRYWKSRAIILPTV